MSYKNLEIWQEASNQQLVTRGQQPEVEREIKMLDIRLFGKLRRFVKEPEAGHDNMMRIAPQSEETLEQLLARIGLFGRDMAALVV